MTDATTGPLGRLLLPGDLVVVGQGVGEPTGLLEELIREHASLPAVEVFVGLSHSKALLDPGAAALSLLSFGAMGPLSALADAGRVAVLPCHFAEVPRSLRLRAPGRLVVLMQVAPADADGFHSLGLAVDYTYELVPHARMVIAEVNDQLPITTAPTVHTSLFAATVPTSRALPVLDDATTGDVHRTIAAHVATLVPDGATIQLGVGALASVVGAALAARHGLKVYSALAGSWLIDLARSGALSDEPDAIVIGEAAGSQALYEFAATPRVQVRSVGDLHQPGQLSGIERFVAMNSALEVDLTGQVNAEELATGFVGGIGGQPDFMRAAQRSADGRSVMMLPATAGRGRRTRIVRHLQTGTVTTPRSAVDFVVTEYGVADLRCRSLTERAEALIAIAAPEHRDSLRTAE